MVKKIKVEVNVNVYLFNKLDKEKERKTQRKYKKYLSVELLNENYGKNCLPTELTCRSAEADCIRDIVIESLRDAIRKLPKKERKCIIRYYYQNMTIKEIALLENISEKTVSKYLKLARETLKKLVE